MFHNGFLISRVWLNKINTPLSESQMKALILRLTCMINSLPGQQKSSTHWNLSSPKGLFILSPFFSLKTVKIVLVFLLNNDNNGLWFLSMSDPVCCEVLPYRKCFSHQGFRHAKIVSGVQTRLKVLSDFKVCETVIRHIGYEREKKKARPLSTHLCKCCLIINSAILEYFYYIVFTYLKRS